VTLRQHDKNVLTLAQQVVKFGRQYIQLTPNSVAPNSVAPNSVAQASKEHADG